MFRTEFFKRRKKFIRSNGDRSLLHSLRLKLILINIISILIPTIIISVSFLYYYRQQVYIEFNVSIQNMLKSISQNVYSYISDVERLMTTIGYDKEILLALESYNLNNIDLFSKKSEEYESLTIQNYLKTSGKYLQSIIIQNEDEGLQYYHRNVNVKLDIDEFYDSSLFNYLQTDISETQDAFTFVGTHAPNYFSFSNSRQVFSIIQSMTNPYKRDERIFIIADLDIAFFREILSDLRFSSPSVFMILDEGNNIVYSNSSAAGGITDYLGSDQRSISVNQVRYHVFSRTIIPSGWKVIALLNNDLIWEKLQWVIITNILASALVLAITLLIFTILSNNLSKSFSEMIHVMEHVKKGDLSAKCLIIGNDELSNLKGSLNDMINKLDEYITKEYKLLLSQRNAEYLALQSQIQPHFLYNTLNGFLWLNRDGRRKTLEDAIINLTGLMRYTLGKDTMVSVEQELDFLRKYCDLQKLRFEDRMNFSINCDSDVLSFKIPKLILQPIVENSVAYAVEPSDHMCNIEIKVSLVREGEDDYVILSVIDDGEGFDIAALPQNGGIGIPNVRERVSLVYPDSSVAIESGINSGTVVRIRILADSTTERI